MHQVLTYTRRDNDLVISRIRIFGLELFLHLSMLVAHGRDYLDEVEYPRCMKDAERQYSLYLGKCACALRRPSAEFWEFHRHGLAYVNCSLDWRLSWKWIPRALLEKSWDTFWASWDAVFDGHRRLRQE